MYQTLIAVFYLTFSLFVSSFTDRLDILAELCKEIELNLVDPEGNSALHLLAKMELSSLVVRCFKLLKKRGSIDPMLKNKTGKTAADIIISRSNEDYKVYEKLFGEQTSKGKKKKKKKVDQVMILEEVTAKILSTKIFFSHFKSCDQLLSFFHSRHNIA